MRPACESSHGALGAVVERDLHSLRAQDIFKLYMAELIGRTVLIIQRSAKLLRGKC